MHHSESIIISKMPLREADLLVTFFSRADGKLKGVARHAKKSQKRFGGTLESGYVVDLQYSNPSNSGLATILQASLITPKLYRPQGLEAAAATWSALEFASRFLPDAEENREKFELLKRFLTAVHEGRLSRPILVFFLLKWISLCGYLPDMDQYVKLGYNLGPETIKTLRSVVSGDIACDIKDQVYEDLLRFVFHYSMVILGKPLKLESYLPVLMEVSNPGLI